MKTLFLAVLLPCMVLAADEAAPISLMSVKPVAPVAADVADKAPDEALKALRNAMSAKAWTQVVERCDALLAIPRTSTADRLEWSERKREALERIGHWDDALAVSMAELALPMASNTLHDVRMRIVRTLTDKLNRPDDAIRLALEIMDDDKSPPDWRADAAIFAASVAQAKKDDERALEILLKASALPTSAMKKRVDTLILAAYKTFYRHEEARALALKSGNRIEAASISASLLDDRPTAKRIYREVLEDESAPHADRVAAWRWFFVLEPKLVERYLPAVLGTTEATTNEAVKILSDMIAARGDSSYSFGGNYDAVRRAYGMLERIHDATGKTWTFPVMQYAANAFCARHDFDVAAKICRDAIEWKVTQDPSELYQLNMMAAIFPLKGDEASIVKAIRAADGKFAGELAPNTRLSRLDRIGGAAVTGANEPLARALATYRKSLFVPMQKREYVVHYSEKPIAGLGGWDMIAPKPEGQLMDRQYGGSMEFLTTDVATGNRGEGIGTEKAAKNAAVPTIEIACDAFGIHFRFEAPDEKADQMSAGFLDGGTYEAYLAPGENEPYYCLLMDVAPNASVSFFNTTYNTTGHRRIRNEDHALYKSETAFTDHSAVSYVMLSWNAFATLIPADKTVWEFENVHWGRADKAAWNGTESIHGRSTWGRLVFDLPEKARIEILKRVIFHVRKTYASAKSKDGMGAAGRWADAVLGDPEFYKKCVEPLLAELDAYLPLVKMDMSDEDVLKVAEEALPRWRDIEYEVARLRTRYMADKFAE